MIDFDPTRKALFQPAARATVFGAVRLATFGLCAELSRLAYQSFERESDALAALKAALKSAGLNYSAHFHDSGTSTQAFAATSDDGKAYLVYRGTEADDPTDLGTDADFVLRSWSELPEPQKVHAGFVSALEQLLKNTALRQWLADHRHTALHLTGHSLGAALATLTAALEKDAALITFGSPRVGNAAFAASFQPDRVHRFVDCSDVVTMVPPKELGYEHVSPACYIDQGGTLRDWSETDYGDPIGADRRDARLSYILEYAWRSGNIGSRSLADHAPINYVRAFVQE